MNEVQVGDLLRVKLDRANGTGVSKGDIVRVSQMIYEEYDYTTSYFEVKDSDGREWYFEFYHVRNNSTEGYLEHYYPPEETGVEQAQEEEVTPPPCTEPTRIITSAGWHSTNLSDFVGYIIAEDEV